MASNNSLLSTSSAKSALAWNSLLEMQVATFFPYELQCLLNSPGWLAAARVLDAGCGNGYFLGYLRRFFPEKTYAGIDLSSELVQAARHNSSLNNVELNICDFFDFQPQEKFDTVIMRLIVQHMSGFQQIFDQLRQILRPNGRLFIIEPDPALFLNHPGIPKFDALIRAYEQGAAQKRLNRASIGRLEEDVSLIAGWRTVKVTRMIAPQIGPFSNTRMLQTYSLWIDIFEQTAALQVAFADVREELNKWAEDERSYCQFGITVAEIEFVGDLQLSC